MDRAYDRFSLELRSVQVLYSKSGRYGRRLCIKHGKGRYEEDPNEENVDEIRMKEKKSCILRHAAVQQSMM